MSEEYGELIQSARAAFERGEFDRAQDAARSMIERRPDGAEGWATLGQALLRAGQAAEGMDALQRARKLAPSAPGVCILLGGALLRLGRLEESLEAYQAVLTLDPANDSVIQNIGALLSTLGRDQEAIEQLEPLVRRRPDQVGAWLNLAQACERLHRLEAAREAAEHVLMVAPANALAQLILASVERRSGDLDGALKRLGPIRYRRDAPAEAAQAWMDCGRILDTMGDYRDALEAFTRGNALTASLPPAQAASAHRMVERIARTRRWLQERSANASVSSPQEADSPVMVVGFPRSGTTLCEQLLAAIPNSISTDEQPLLEETLREADRLVGHQGWLPRGLESGLIDGLRRFYWSRASARFGGSGPGGAFIDKNPFNLLLLPLAEVVFPGVRGFTMLRDPRDVCLSCFMQNFAMNDAMVHFLTLEGTISLYEQVMGLWVELRDRLSMPVFEVKYEDLVVDPEHTGRAMMAFLGRSWDDAMLGFGERVAGRSVRTPSYESVVKPLGTQAIGRWRRYADLLGPTIDRLAPLVRKLGYEE